MEIDSTRNVAWQFGETKHPSKAIDHISIPFSIKLLKDGLRGIADTRNHRVLLIDVDGTSCEVMPHDGTLRIPSMPIYSTLAII